MGIQGLLPFVEKSSRRANMKEFSGMTVAIDAYCWLHKGAFSCAEKLVMNEPTTMYVSYCMKFINMMLSHNVKPILVFDGRNLAAKSGTEQKRRESREVNRKKGAELLRAGHVEEGRSHLRRSLDVNHEMALNVIREARRRNVDCIVAPYEADAQLAYLNIAGIAQVVVTEDSDLLLFGCEKVLFKMDVNGNGILVEKDRLHLSMGVRPDLFSFDKFRYMCILSGCDYLPNLPGIGLGKACKFLKRTSETDIYKALRKLAANLNMWTLVVTDEYRDSFVAADRTFRCQLVYDPVSRRQVPLSECEAGEVVGELLDETTALDLALGNLDPMSMRRMDSFNPDVPQTTNRFEAGLRAPHRSIWSKNYVARAPRPQNSVLDILRPSTKSRTVTTSVTLARKRQNNVPAETTTEPTSQELLKFYGGGATKRVCKTDEDEDNSEPVSSVDEASSQPSEPTSPVLTIKNPFAVKNLNKMRRRGGALASFLLASESDSLCSSRYFSSSPDSSGSVLDALDTPISVTDTFAPHSPPHAVHIDAYNKNCPEDEKEPTIKSSQEENSSYLSNRCSRPYYTPSTPSPEDTVAKETSSFFEKSDHEVVAAESVAAANTTSPPAGKKLTLAAKRPGLGKPKQQTLLSMYKFQSRPKM